jgi:drug/metabolite transporter (DMT)-like permease
MNANTTTGQPASRGLLIAAFTAVYLVWGSTYLAIRVAVETMPPFLMAATRFLFAGLTLFALLWLRKVPMPTGPQWRSAFISGNLLLVGGNGLVVWAEQTVSSSLAALIIATTPAWFALLDWLRPGGTRPRLQTVIGICVGFGGVSLLVNLHGKPNTPGEISLIGIAAVVAATALWAAGTLHSKHNPKPESLFMAGAIQMICGGAGLLLTSLILSEPARAHWSDFSAHSIWSLLYLIVFGSWVAFSAYAWLVKHTTSAKLSTYAYVNPVIAVFLGWLFLKEPITSRTLCAGAIILAGVIIITLPPKVTDVFRFRK